MNKKFLSALIVGSFLASFNCLATERNSELAANVLENLAYKIKVVDLINPKPGLPGEVEKIITRIGIWGGRNNYVIILTSDEKNDIGYLTVYQETRYPRHISIGEMGIVGEKHKSCKNKNMEENDVINKLVPKLQKIYGDIDIAKYYLGDKKAAFLNLGFEERGDALVWHKKKINLLLPPIR